MTEINFDPSILENYFDLKVTQACRSCKRYGLGQCPPNVPKLEFYKKLLPSYKNGIIIYERFEIEGDWKEQGRTSSLKLQSYLVSKRLELLNEGRYYSIALGGGSCKFCLKCVTPCQNPDKAIVPLEGCGIDVIKLMKEYDIHLKFPVEQQGFFYRIGMILYD